MHPHLRLGSALLLLGALPLSAQSKFGIVAGAVTTNISFRNSVGFDPEWRTGFAAGVTTSIGSGRFQLHPEAIYVIKGYDYADDAYQIEAKLTYVEVPLLLRLVIGAPESKSFLTAGPSLGFNLTCEDSVDDGDCKAHGSDGTGIKSNDIGMVIGAGTGFGRVTLSIRKEMSLSNISTNTVNPAKNQVWMVMAGFGF